MKRKLLLLSLAGLMSLGSFAQRRTDVLDRGLVAVKTSSGVYCSWRITGEEYYDTKYNIYRDGIKLNSEPLDVSNFTDRGGTEGSAYTVEAVVRGVAQAKSKAVTPWKKNYKEIKMDHGSLTSVYIPNDACVADVDGDGEVEILLKFDNRSDAEGRYMPEGYNGEYAIAEIYKLDGTKLWWLDFGPNMADFQNNENNIVAYDWDGDGKAEAVMRAADGTVIHKADGTTVVIGDKSKNYRSPNGGGGANFFMHDGDEFLLYLNGATGDVYQQMEYPLKRLEPGETNLEAAWGDGYGHRSTKHFFGAPYLDGKKPSIFLARGIYTRHKMVAFDVDPQTHKLVERWRWVNNTPGSPWYGQGYHNFGIADVDWDGRDEIVFGSMVIDDNGKGLSTTGLGHGDAQHCSDFDPYKHGQEIFACNEDRPGNNFRDATTSKIYYRYTAGNDDGRSIMGNFIDEYPGAQGTSSRDPGLVSSVMAEAIPSPGTRHIAQNFRIYWDGDLCEETFNYVNGKNTEGAILKARTGTIAVLEGSMTNNDTKGTPCLQGDILGDWREEVIMRTADNNIRIYTTDVETPWRNYTLWHDHQYRNAMVWQMCGYNQPPHASYFLGELEGITIAPPPLTNTGRTEIPDGATIGTSNDDKHIMMSGNGNMTVAVADGAKPYIFTDNAPTWVQGNNSNDNITTEVYTHTLTGGAFTGGMRLVKQGDGILRLPTVTETYTGPTNVWAGTLKFDGTMQNSRVWLNRHAILASAGGKFRKGIQMDYNATLEIGEAGVASVVEADSLIMNFGSVLSLDLFSEGFAADVVKANVLKIERKDWQYGPKYSTPVIRIEPHVAEGANVLAAGKYLVGEVAKIDGNVADFVVEGLAGVKSELLYEDGKLYINVIGLREATETTWTGENGSSWDVANTENFKIDGVAATDIFVDGDIVVFNDDAVATDVNVVNTVSPKSVVFENNTKTYTLNGGSIAGTGNLVKNGTGTTVINSSNSYSGGTVINEGTLTVSSLANNEGTDFGAVGGPDATIAINNAAILNVTSTSKTSQQISVGEGGGTLNVGSGVTLTIEKPVASAVKAPLYKRGTGTLILPMNNRFGKMYINNGTVQVEPDLGNDRPFADSVIFTGNSTLRHVNSYNSYNNDNSVLHVNRGVTANLYLDGRCNYRTRLSGEGTLNIYPQDNISRAHLGGDWTGFYGKVSLLVNGSYNYLDFMDGADLSNCTLEIGNGFTMSNEFKNNSSSAATKVNVRIGSLAGNGTLTGGGVYYIGADGSDINFQGTISSAVQKIGAGMWTITKAQPTIGRITLAQGSINLGNVLSISDLLGNSSSITVLSGAKLLGQGAVPTVTLRSGAILQPGRNVEDFSGEIKVNKNAVIPSGAIVNMNIRNASNTLTSRSHLNVVGNLSMNGTVNVTLSPGYTPAVGDEIVLWTAGTFSGTPELNLPQLPQALAWNTDDLLTAKGTLRIVNAGNGIFAESPDIAVHCRVFTASGMLLTEYDAALGDAVRATQSKGLASGTYVLQLQTPKYSKVVKVVIR